MPHWLTPTCCTASVLQHFQQLLHGRTLSDSCLLTAASLLWLPGVSCGGTTVWTDAKRKTGQRLTQRHALPVAVQQSVTAQLLPLGSVRTTAVRRTAAGTANAASIDTRLENLCQAPSALAYAWPSLVVGKSWGKALPEKDPSNSCPQRVNVGTRPTHPCFPGRLTWMSTLKRGGRHLSSLTRSDSPMRVAMEQCATVGVKRTLAGRNQGHAEVFWC